MGTRKVAGPPGYGMRRTMQEKIQGVKARVGGIAKGEEPGGSAPRVLPAGAAKGPSLKPRGTSTMKEGGTQSVIRGRALMEKAKKSK